MSVPRPAMLVAMVDRAEPPGLFDDMGFLFVEARVEHDVLDAFLLQEFAEHLALFDRDGADQNRLVALPGLRGSS